jgi:hypothetical protein
MQKGGTWLELELFDRSDLTETLARLEEMGVLELTSLDRRSSGGKALVRCVVPEGALQEYLERVSALPSIRWIGEVPQQVDDNTLASAVVQSGSVQLHSVWARGLTGKGQVIGMIDNSRVDLAHCFFAGHQNEAAGPEHRKVIAIRDASNTPLHEHSTFVAGCLAGDDLNRPGKADFRGGAYDARLVSGNRLDLAIPGLTDLGAELAAAALAGAKIHSNSWHDVAEDEKTSTVYNQNAAHVDRFTWANEDQLVVGSAGNSGEHQGPPGTAKNAICVGAVKVRPGNPPVVVGCDGCPGPTDDGRRKPDLVAPGGRVLSSKVNSGTDTFSINGCSSSFASPHVAAAAALLRQYFTEGWFPSGEPGAHPHEPSGALLKAMLICSTRNLQSERPGYSKAQGEGNCPAPADGYPNHKEGWGLVCLDNVLFFSDSAHRLVVEDVRHAEGLHTNDRREIVIKVESSDRPLKVVLVWTDPPATVGVSPNLVNNLDLEARSPDGRLFRGNNFAPDGFSVEGGEADAKNNVEVVRIQTPEPGDWMISVTAALLGVGTPGQGFALVSTAAR